ncbi:MAG: ABC transporter ATP-binding protein [Tistlia sp.]|uniref:ABC transporter ATP-binding protein n=1 Tax=Tistlia sp. TaxID=3057121 RepID=UPI0034A4A12F
MTDLLAARGLGIAFGGVVALRDFELSVAEGDLLGLIGPNGAGKTTAFNLLSGVLAGGAGSIRFAGQDISRASPERRARLGMTRTFQNIRLFEELTVLQNVMAGAHARHGAGLFDALFGGPRLRRSEAAIRERAEAVLARTGLGDLARQRADALSYGDRRRVEIARALASEPRLLLLDEPAAGMNEREKADLSTLITRLNADDGLTIVLVEHNVRMVAGLCRRLLVLHKGERLAEGPTEEVLRDPDVVAVYLGRRRQPAAVAASAPC